MQREHKGLEKRLSSEYRQACITSRLAKLFTQVKLGNNPSKSWLSDTMSSHASLLSASASHSFRYFCSLATLGSLESSVFRMDNPREHPCCIHETGGSGDRGRGAPVVTASVRTRDAASLEADKQGGWDSRGL